MKRTEDVWRDKWKKWEKTLGKENQLPLWNYEYELTYSILTGENVISRGKTCLEAGSGTGRMSLRIARDGAKPILFDVSKKAIEFSKRLFILKNVEADFVVGSILNLPFRPSCLDIVWSAGVLEHFTPEKQQMIVHESLRVLRQKGKFIAIVPNRRALFYNFFRILSQKVKAWPFGYEEPLTVEDFKKFSPKPLAFHSCGWIFTQFNHIFMGGVAVLIRGKVMNFIECVLKSHYIAIEKSRPGLILAAVWVK